MYMCVCLDYFSDACHTLTCAIMLLNTDLHGQVLVTLYVNLLNELIM